MSTSLFRWAGALVLTASIAMALLYDPGALIAGAPLFAGTILTDHLDRGYRISFNDDAIYMHPHGIACNLGRRAERRLPFDRIAAVQAERSGRSIS